MKDNVNHPSHYTQGGIECIDALEAATTGLEGIEAVCTANAIKYLWRWKYKNGVEDIDKAIWYLQKLRSKVTDEGQTDSAAQEPTLSALDKALDKKNLKSGGARFA